MKRVPCDHYPWCLWPHHTGITQSQPQSFLCTGILWPCPRCTGTPTSYICWPIPDTKNLFKLVHLRTPLPASDNWWSSLETSFSLETSLNLFTWGPPPVSDIWPETCSNLFTWVPIWCWHLVTDFWSTYSWRAGWNALLFLVRKAWRSKEVLYFALLDRHREIKPSDGCARELMIPRWLTQSSISNQTLREAPSYPHVEGFGKHVYLDRSPNDTHCWNVLLVVTALEIWISVKKTKQEINESFLSSIRKFI